MQLCLSQMEVSMPLCWVRLETEQKRLLWRLISYDFCETRYLICPAQKKINKTTFDQYTELAKDAFKALGVATYSIDDLKSLPASYFPTEEVVRLKNEIRLMRFVLFD